MSGGPGLKWSLLGAGLIVMLLKVVLLLRFDQLRKSPSLSSDSK